MSANQERIADLIAANMRGEDIGEEGFAEVKGYDYEDLTLGMALQMAVMKRFVDAGNTIGGYKAAMTSGSSRDFFGPGYRAPGFILSRNIYESGAKVELSKLNGPGLEPEICVIMGKHLQGADLSVEEAKDAIAAVAPAYEINEKRDLSRVPHTVRIGNAIGAWAMAVGAERDLDLDLHGLQVERFHDGVLVDSGDSGPARVDDPYLSIARICRELATQGRGLEAGQRVITGSLLDNIPPTPGEWTTRFGDLGSVTVTFV